MNNYTTVIVSAKPYAGFDNSLAAAENDYADDHGCGSWEVSASWADDNHETIALRVPA